MIVLETTLLHDAQHKGADTEQKGPWCFDPDAERIGSKGGEKVKLPKKYLSGAPQRYEDWRQRSLHSMIDLQRKFACNADAHAERRDPGCFAAIASFSGFAGIGAQRRFGRLLIVDLQYFWLLEGKF